MKKIVFLSLISAIAIGSYAQKKPAEKAPTQKEMQEMMKEAQGMMDQMMKEMSPEDKKMMDSMGIKMPDLNKSARNVANVTDGQLADAWEKENRIVFPKNAKKIAAIPGPVSNAGIGSYIGTVQSKTNALLKPATRSMGEKIYSKFAASGKSPAMIGNAAAALWMMGKIQIAFVVMGKACAAAPSNTDNTGNYASMLSMLGAPELALPILNNLNARFPKNSTILNNLGQAWFGLGDMIKAEKYLDSTVKIFANHTQANATKALIEESRGKKPEAIAALKRSIRGGYSDDKKSQLAQLGYKLSINDFTLPGKKKPDPFNLGGFQPPAYPVSVIECVVLGGEWNQYRAKVNEEMERLKQLKKEQEDAAMKEMQAKANTDLNMIKAAMANPGSVSGPLKSAPMFAERAGKKMTAAQETYARKITALGEKIKAAETELKARKDAYEKKMADLKEQDNEQTGEGKPNKDFCPQYRDATDEYLKIVNPKKEELFKEFLQIEKEYINECAHWSMYALWPNGFEAFKTGLKLQWLNDFSANSGFNFISITEYVCKAQTKGKEGKLQKFDDVACQYHSSFWTPVGTMQMDCSNWTTKLDVGVLSVELKQDMDQQTFGDQFQNCTIELGPKLGREVELGPLTVGAEAGVGVGVEIDRSGVKDVFVTAGAEAGASIGDPISISAGMEGRISMVSGTAAVNGTGVFESLP
ncbi:MAG: hypothetical protein QM687_09750 [Ferruginibacter sp.]